MLKYLLETKPDNINLKPLIHDNNLDLLKILYQIGKLTTNYNNTNKYLEYACQKGQLQFIIWYTSLPNRLAIDYETLFYEACMSNNLLIARYFVATLDNIKYKDSVKYTFCRASELGKYEVVRWLYEEFTIIIHEFNHYAFRWASNNGHLSIVKWLHKIEKVDNEDIIYDALKSSLVNNHLAITTWLLSNYRYVINMVDRDDLIYACCVRGNHTAIKYIMNVFRNGSSPEVGVNWDDIFCLVCKYGHIETAKWILDDPLSINPNMGLPISRAFLFAIEFGELDIVTWLYNMYDTMDNSIIQESFKQACYFGKKDIVMWLYYLPEFIESESVMNMAFTQATTKKHFDIAKWLYNCDDCLIDIHREAELAFRKGCEANNLKFVEWLYSTDSSINIRVLEDHCFMHVCNNHYIELAIWLKNKCDSYVLCIIDNDIIEYKVISYLDRAFKVLDTDYNQSLSILNITRNSDNKDDMYCVICRSTKDKVIKTSCNHVYCLHCLLSWFISTKVIDDFKCAYCRTIFNFVDCMHIG